MQILTSGFAILQKMGKALMLPVSVLPIAGILLGLGSAHFSVLPDAVSTFMAQAGGAVFTSLPIIFAIAVAIGLSDNDGVAALAAVVGYFVLVASLGVMASLFGVEPTPIFGIPSMDTGVFGGLIIGIVAAGIFTRFYRIQLPPYLGFFAGKRSVPILTALAAIGLAVVFGAVWPPIQAVIDRFSAWAASGNPRMAFALYGIVERSLLPFGLHHIWNVPFFFQVGEFANAATGEIVRGEIQRFTAGDPTAGNMAGGYLFKMWGLPAAAVAIWHSARPDERLKVGGVMISAALTSFLTGITEPIEFSFLFVAPLLYGIHAVLAAVAYFTCIQLGIKHGTTFSHGLVDYVLLFPKSTHALWFLVIGPLWAAMYYGIFRWAIAKFDLKTPGRDPEEGASAAPVGDLSGAYGLAPQLIRAFGGRGNIAALDACITRLRVEVRDPSRARADVLKSLGAAGVVVVGHNVQAIFGPRSDNLKSDMSAYLKAAGAEADEMMPTVGEVPAVVPAAVTAAPPVEVTAATRAQAAQVLAALGGAGNIRGLAACAGTRIRIEHGDGAIDEAALARSGVRGVMRLPHRVIHLVVGPDATTISLALQALVPR